MFQKLQWLRDEEKSGKTVNFQKKQREDEFSEKPDINFFLDGIAEVEMDADGQIGEDEASRAAMKAQDEQMKLEEEFGYFL